MIFTYGLIVLYSPYILYLLYWNLTPLEIYNTLHNKWGGNIIFNFIIGSYSPYSSSIYPNIEYYDNTRCTVSMKSRRCVKNIFNSVHALALGNLGELAAGLVMLEYLSSMTVGKGCIFKGIVTKVECEYYKKARGTITAYCKVEDKSENVIFAELKNESGDLVCKVICYWDIKTK